MKTKLTISPGVEYSASSQNGEDGVIQHIFNLIGTTDRVCVEIGVSASGEGIENNTLNLINRGWTGYWFDLVDVGYSAPNCKFIKEKVTADNVVSLFVHAGIPKNIDLLSIDIDSNDYYVRKALSEYNPAVCIMEYNGCYDSATEYVMPRDDNYVWRGQRNFGASLAALAAQANRLGYDLVYCDSHGINAFFVRKDINVFLAKTANEAYVLPSVPWITQEKLLRRHTIINLYKKILNRMADEDGITHYLHSSYSLIEIERILLDSKEAKLIATAI